MAHRFSSRWLAPALFFAGVCAAQTSPPILRGTVRNEKGRAISGALVTVTAASRERAYKSITLTSNAAGSFEAFLQPGRYWIEVKAEGFEAGAAVVDLAEASTLDQSFVLKRIPLEQTPNPFRGPRETEVSGTIKDQTEAVISFATIEIRSKLPNNPTYVIRTDEIGAYHAILAVGEYSVMVKARGFKTQAAELRVHKGKAESLDFKLVIQPYADEVQTDHSQ